VTFFLQQASKPKGGRGTAKTPPNSQPHMTGSELPRELQRLRTEADYMRFLIAAGELLSSSLNYRQTLANVCRAAVETIADICILDLGSVGEVQPYGAAHRDAAMSPSLEAAGRHLVSEPGRPAHPVCHVLDTGRTFFAPDIDDAWIERHASSTEHAEFMRKMRYRSMIVVPVRSQIWGLTGALTLVRTAGSKHAYDTGAIAFAEDLGRRCGIAIGKARLHSQTIDIAERFQRAALPKSLPQVDGLRLDAFYEPADAALLVGGDWYDAFLLRDERIGISIGDVSGHGIEAAALMSSIRNAIRMALVMEDDLVKVLRDADFLFRNEAPEGSLCTCLVALFDVRTKRLTCASAGHPSPLMFQNGNVEQLLDSPMPPLGFVELASAIDPARTLDVAPGSMLVFYTDGLVEWERDVVAGEAALREALADAGVRDALRPALAVRQACIRGAHADDVAILTVRYEGN
jgi:GAF domain-containing protein